jgi:hypothetical protein
MTPSWLASRIEQWPIEVLGSPISRPLTSAQSYL